MSGWVVTAGVENDQWRNDHDTEKVERSLKKMKTREARTSQRRTRNVFYVEKTGYWRTSGRELQRHWFCAVKTILRSFAWNWNSQSATKWWQVWTNTENLRRYNHRATEALEMDNLDRNRNLRRQSSRGQYELTSKRLPRNEKVNGIAASPGAVQTKLATQL